MGCAIRRHPSPAYSGGPGNSPLAAALDNFEWTLLAADQRSLVFRIGREIEVGAAGCPSRQERS